MTTHRSKNETKRKQILCAATTLFTEQGYASTSMAIIAKQADVSKQTVYSHFGSKDELFAAAIEQKCDATLMLDVETIDISSPAATLLQIAQRFVAMITSSEAIAVHKICAFESNSYPQLSELFYHAGPERLTNDMTKLFERMAAENLLAINNARFAALQYLNMIKGEMWMRAEFNISEELSQSYINDYLSESIALFIRGYAINQEPPH